MGRRIMQALLADVASVCAVSLPAQVWGLRAVYEGVTARHCPLLCSMYLLVIGCRGRCTRFSCPCARLHRRKSLCMQQLVHAARLLCYLLLRQWQYDAGVRGRSWYT